MFGIGTGELIMILIIAMMVVGPERMVEISKQIGQMVAKLRQQTESVTREFRDVLTLETGSDDEAAPPAADTTGSPSEAEAPAVGEHPETPDGVAAVAATETDAASAAPMDEIETPEDQLQAELAAALFDGEIEVVAAEAVADDGAPRSAGAEQVIIIDIAQLVPEDVNVEAVLLDEPILVLEQATASEIEEPAEGEA